MGFVIIEQNQQKMKISSRWKRVLGRQAGRIARIFFYLIVLFIYSLSLSSQKKKYSKSRIKHGKELGEGCVRPWVEVAGCYCGYIIYLSITPLAISFIVESLFHPKSIIMALALMGFLILSICSILIKIQNTLLVAKLGTPLASSIQLDIHTPRDVKKKSSMKWVSIHNDLLNSDTWSREVKLTLRAIGWEGLKGDVFRNEECRGSWNVGSSFSWQMDPTLSDWLFFRIILSLLVNSKA